MKQYKGKYLTIVDIKDVMYDIVLQEIDGMNEKEARNYLLNDVIPVTGSVSNLIYYAQLGIYIYIYIYIILGNEENINEIIEIAKRKGIINE